MPSVYRKFEPYCCGKAIYAHLMVLGYWSFNFMAKNIVKHVTLPVINIFENTLTRESKCCGRDKIAM